MNAARKIALRYSFLLLGGVLSSAAPVSASTVTFDFAQVGNAGNAADPTTGFGAVSYDYAIAKTEVTNAQYTEFLNTVAATDSFALYNPQMGSSNRGGIVRSGSSGSFTYTVKPNHGDKPVNFVSFLDAMRFTNWLHNGQGSGGTESGAYTIGHGLNEVRSTDARFWIPSLDEWYKAAYHQPASQGGDGDDYWLYPTASNTAPTIATANGVGDISNPGANVANYDDGAEWNSQRGNVTTVGSAGPLSANFYGTFDQAGNVWEFNEMVIGSPATPTSGFRSLRGGSWTSVPSRLEADLSIGSTPFGGIGTPAPLFEASLAGFRVATVAVPEPSSVLMGALAAAGLWLRRRG